MPFPATPNRMRLNRSMAFIYLAHVLATLYMTGLIWFVQIVHYPLMNRVGTEGFAAYEKDHQNLTAYVVGPAMLIEALTAVYFLMVHPLNTGALWAWVGLGLVAVNWLATTYLQVPQHNRLAGGFNETAYRVLVTSNWIRTVGWSVRAVWVLYPLASAFDPL